jgi:2-amino-4-hydroxy-6-hydroxymethyldihydropteridine diphosphokinase
MTTVALSLGTNVGDRLANLQKGLKGIESHLRIIAVSKVYETAPMYIETQADFYNAAALVETEIGPLDLLKLVKGLENELGRTASSRFGPREIDIDLISYGSARYSFFMKSEEQLTLPHPRVGERRFVLQPLADMDPNLNLPGLGSVQDLLKSTDSQAKSVRKVSDALLPLLSGR